MRLPKLLAVCSLITFAHVASSQTTGSTLVGLSAADYRAYVAPASLAAVFGANLSDATMAGQVDATGQFSTQLSGTTLSVCGESAGLEYISPTQINFVVPSDLLPGLCPLVVSTNGRTFMGSADVRSVSPGLFSILGSTANSAAAFNAVTYRPPPFSILTAENNSSDKGTRISLFGTGFRNAMNSATAGVDGLFALVTSGAGDSWSVPIEYAGPAPGFIGVDQLNIALPGAVDGTGFVTITVTADSVRSNPVILDIAGLNAPMIASVTPLSAAPGSPITVLGSNLGVQEMIESGRAVVSLTTPSGNRVAVSPEFVNSSHLQFTLPPIPQDSSTLYYGPVSLCVEVDGKAACTSSLNVVSPTLSGTGPGQTFLSVTKDALQSGIAFLTQQGASQSAQALSAMMNSLIAQYTGLVGSAVAGNPQTITVQRSDGSQLSGTVDAALINRLDLLAASLQPLIADISSSVSNAPLNNSALQPSCTSSDENSLIIARDVYHRSKSASEALIEAAAFTPIAGAVLGCVGTDSVPCMASVSTTVLPTAEITAHLLSGLLYYPIFAALAIQSQPVFLDSIEIAPSPLSQTVVPGGSALVLAPSQGQNLTVLGNFVPAPVSVGSQQFINQIVSKAVAAFGLGAPGSTLATLVPQLSADLTTIFQNDFNGIIQPSAAASGQRTVPLTAGTVRVDPIGTPEVSIMPACTGSPASVTGESTTGGKFEQFRFAVDPGTLLLSHEVSPTALPGSVYSVLNVAVGPAAPQLQVRTDKTSYGNGEQVYVSGSGFPPFTAVPISISGPSLNAKVEATAFSDGSGAFAISVPLQDVLQSGAYTLTASVQNSTLTASASISVSANRLFVQVTPEAGNWTTSPQAISVNAPGAAHIYYNYNQSAGAVPPVPPAPSVTTHDGVIDGQTGSIQLAGIDGQLTIWTYVFVAEDANGLGSVSPPYTFSIDLRHAVPAPQITSITSVPSQPLAGQTFRFQVSGSNFDPTMAQVTFNGPGCPAGCMVSTSALIKTSTDLFGFIQLSGGTYTVTVQNGLSARSNASPFTVGFGTPAVSAITTSPNPPSSGQAFDFTIGGTGFDPASAVVMFAKVACSGQSITSAPPITAAVLGDSSLSSKSSNELSGNITLGEGCFNAIVQNGSTGTPSNAASLLVAGARVNAISTLPAPPQAGQPFSLTINGSGFDPVSVFLTFTGPGCTAPANCTIPTSVLSTVTSSQLTGTVVLPAGTFSLRVQNGASGAPSNAVSVTVTTPAPKISSITPTSVIAGASFGFTITGTGFDPATVIVVFSGSGCASPCVVANSALTSKTSTSLSGSGPVLPAGTYNVAVQNGPSGALSNSVALTVSSAPAVTAPQVTSINTVPGSPIAGQAFMFAISGTGFDPNSAIVTFTGPGCTPSCTISNNALSTSTSTLITGSVTLQAGAFTVTVQNGSNGTPSASLALTVAQSGTVTPQLTAITTSPNPPMAGQSFTFTLTGSGFDPNTVMVTISGPGCPSSGCAVPNIALSSGTSSTSLSGSATLSSGAFTFTVQNGPTGTPSNSLPLTVAGTSTSTSLQLSSISTTPSPAIAGQPFIFTITGTGFDPNNATVLFSGPGCASAPSCSIPRTALATASSTQLTGAAVLPQGTYSVTVANTLDVSNSIQFTVGMSSSAAAPQITQFVTTPNPPAAGQAFSFSISGTGFDPGTAAVLFNGPNCAPCLVSTAQLSSISSSQISGSATLGSGSFNVVVQNGSNGTSSNSISFSVAGSATPQITTVSTSPNPPISGQAFTFSISGTGFDPNSAVLVFNGPGCAPCTLPNSALSSKSSSSLSGTATLGAGKFTVTVQNGSGSSSTSAQLVVSNASGAAPQLTAVSTTPNPAQSGQSFTFTLTGSGFDPNSAVVLFNGPACTPCTVSNAALSTKTATQLIGTITLGAGTFTISAKNGVSGALSTGQTLTVSAGAGAIQLSSITTAPNPPAGSQSFTFTLTGTGFDPNTANVLFNGPGCTPCTVANAALSTKTASQLTGSATLQSGTFTVTVQNGTGATSNSLQLSVANSSGGSGAPQITSIATSPASPVAGQMFTLTVTGTGFDPASAGISIAGPGCATPCTYANSVLSTKTATQLVATVTLTTAGMYTVTAQNGSGPASNASSLTVSSSSAGGGGGLELDTIYTLPNPPIHGQSTEFALSGAGFDPNSAIVVFKGPGGFSATLSGSQIFVYTSGAAISGAITFPSAGSYTVTVQNGASGRPAMLTFTVQ